MDHQEQEQIALHRWAVIAEAASHRLTAAERGAGPADRRARSRSPRRAVTAVFPGTIDRWIQGRGGPAAWSP